MNTNWKTYKLGDIATMKYGKLPPKESLGEFPIWSGYRIVGTTNTFNCEKGTIIVVARGVGGTGDVKIAKEDCFLTNLSISVSLDTTICDPQYFYYKFSLNNLRYLDSGSAQSQITIDDLKRLTLSLPSLEEQRKIAGILGAIDDKIENNRRINDNLEQQAQALYKQWFVDNRSEDWEVLELDTVAKISAGGDKPQICSKQKTDEYRIPIFSNGIDNEGLYGYTNTPRILENSITISARGTIGFVCLRTEPYVPIVRLISVIPIRENLSAEFLYLWAITQNISGTGTTQQQLTVPDFRKTNIVIPETDLLRKFNEVIMPIFSKIKQNKEECENLATLRDTLLPKLMNGKIKTK